MYEGFTLFQENEKRNAASYIAGSLIVGIFGYFLGFLACKNGKIIYERSILMKLGGMCKILKIYISEDSKYKGHNLYHAIVFKLREAGMAGVTVTRGIEGFGQEKRLHTARILDLSLSLPIIVRGGRHS